MLLAAFAWWMSGRPVAKHVDPAVTSRSKINADIGETLTLRGVTGALLDVNAKPGASLAVDASAAQLDPATGAVLAALGKTVPPGSLPVRWFALGGGGRTSVTVSAEAAAMAVDLYRSGPPDSFDFVLVPHGGSLRVDAVEVVDGPAQGTELVVGTQRVVPATSTAMPPVGLHVPDGATVTIRMAMADAGASSFALGPQSSEAAAAGVLRIAAATISDTSGSRAAWCGAAVGRTEWHEAQPSRMTDCAPMLTATKLTPGDGIAIDLGGTGFIQQGDAPSLWEQVKGNPLLWGLVGALFSFSVGWLVKSVTALIKPPASPVAQADAPR